MNQEIRFSFPPLSRLNKIIVTALASLFLLNSLCQLSLHFSFYDWLILDPYALWTGQLWRVATYPVVIPGLFHLVMSVLIFWMTAGELEIHWGQFVYKKFLLTTVLLSGASYTLIQFVGTTLFHTSIVPLFGLAGLNFALLFSYARIFPDRQFSFFFLFNLPAKYYCMLLAAMEVYQMVFASSAQGGMAIFGHLWTGLVGFSFLNLLSWQTLFRRNQKSKSQKQAELLRKSFKVITTEDKKDPPKYWH
jgi:membrane associated rhomboid family serine protease